MASGTAAALNDNPRPMSTPALTRPRVLSGMRPTGALHLGHFHGAIKNWVRLQDSHDCFFFVADWHALTTSHPDRDTLSRHVYEMVTDWLAAGIGPVADDGSHLGRPAFGLAGPHDGFHVGAPPGNQNHQPFHGRAV